MGRGGLILVAASHPPQSKEDLKQIIHTLTQAGHKALLVGGVVRDEILGIAPGDADLLTDAPIEILENLFKVPRVTLAGKSLPICIVHHIEVAPGRGGGDFPRDDLARRDFTVNAMARDPESGEIIDPFGGSRDIHDGLIRFTGTPKERITEDPLRMVRGCRFAARFGFDFDPETEQAIRDHAPLLDNVARERLIPELVKAMAMKIPSRFFNLLHDTGLLERFLPSLDRCWGLDGGPFHGETVFEHCMMVGDAVTPKQPLLRLAGFLHDTGKFDAKGIKDGRLTYHGHEKKTSALEQDLRDLRFSNKDREYILSLVRCHMRPLTDKTTPKSVRRLLAALAEEGLSTADFMRLRIADKKSNLKKLAPYTVSDLKLRLNKIRAEQEAGHAVTQNQLALSGREIMDLLALEPGPRVGEIKAALLEQVLEDPTLNTRQGLTARVLALGGDTPELP